MRGLVETIYFTNTSGISEFLAVDMDDGSRVRMRGFLLRPKIGAKLCFENLAKDPDGCTIFQNTYLLLETREEASRVLCGADGISKKTAEKIIDACGINVPEYLKMPDLAKKLRSVPGLGPSKTAALTTFLKTQADHSDEFGWLTATGLTYSSATTLLKLHGASVKEWVLKDPYQLLYARCADFRLCDRIAKAGGEDPWSSRRICAILYAAVSKELKNGNTRCELDRILKQCERASTWDGGTAVPQDLFSLHAYNDRRFRVTQSGGSVYLASAKSDKAEDSICKDVLRLRNSARKLELLTDKEYTRIETDTGVKYNEEQTLAFPVLASGGIMAITGFPGTGKTTLLNGLIRYITMREPDAKILLCAPTGRAASRMAEVSGHAGITMHRAVHITPYDHAVRSTEPLEYRFIIADEMSMCDTDLCARFFSSVKSGAFVILTGDPDQLPSVGAGQVFRDLIASGAIPVCRLTMLMRQKEGSMIAINARGSLEGEVLREGSDFKIVQAEDEDMANMVVWTCAKFPVMPLILSPVIGGPAGVAMLNQRMQEQYRKSDISASINGIRFYVGDPVIMTHNNYNLEYFNGETGTVAAIGEGYLTVAFKDRSVTMELADATDVALAYAITVHRAQGTENDRCIVILPSYAYRMATGELLNTAFTRAKKDVLLIATKPSMDYHTTHGRGALRCCGLLDKLIAAIG